MSSGSEELREVKLLTDSWMSSIVNVISSIYDCITKLQLIRILILHENLTK